MVMMLPFLTGAAAVWYGILGRRPACFLLWLMTFVLFVVSARAHLGGALPFVL